MMKRYLGATALVLVLGAPAYAQTTINQFTAVGGVVQNQSNGIVVTGPGTSITGAGSQAAQNEMNVVGPTAYVAVGSPFTVQQGAGVTAPNVVTSPVTQTANNNIAATGISPSVVANVTAGGNQSAINVLNSANIAPVANGSGSIVQNSTGSVLSATNAMSATVQNGNAAVIGANGNGPGFQNAFGSINTVGLSVTTSAAVDLDQKFFATNNVTATNSAIANTVAAGSTTLDPAVQNIAQTSQVGLNQVGIVGAGTTTLTGSQEGPLGGSRNVVTVGNTAVGYTGAAAANYNVGTAVAGNGVAVVSGVTQETSYGLNNIQGGAGVNLALDPTFTNGAAGFTQLQDGVATTIVTPAGNPAGTVNNIVARTNEGSATVTGVARTQASDDFTQSFVNQQNTISTGGSLSGTATQSSGQFASLGANPTNSVTASAVSGPSSINNVSQNANTSYNSASAGSISNLSLNQVQSSSGGLSTIAQANAQTATTATGPASITGAVQNANTGVNSVSAVGASNVQLGQSTTSLTLTNGNTLTANGSNSATISGALQVSSLSANTASLGSASGTITQTSGNVTLAGTNTLASSTTFNASVGGTQQSTSSVNVIK